MDNCYGLGKLWKGWMRCSSQGCEKELDGFFLLSVWGQDLEFMTMGTSCICKAFLCDYECDIWSFHRDKYDAGNLTSLQTALSCQHDSLFSFCVNTVVHSESQVSLLYSHGPSPRVVTAHAALYPGCFFLDSSDLFLVIFACCIAVDISETKWMNKEYELGTDYCHKCLFS